MGLPEALMIGGATVGAFGEYQAGAEDEATARYNAMVKQREADAILQRGRVESRRQAEVASQQMKTLGLATPGITAESDLGLILEQARQSELENMMIGYDVGTEVKGKKEQARELIRQGKAAKRAGIYKAGTTLLTGFGSAFK